MTASKQHMDELDRAVTDLRKRVEALERAQGTAGTGECICPISPEASQRTAERMLEWPYLRHNDSHDMLFEHRCSVHGEKAQPAVWGRHKELTLSVPWEVWESLGVIREVKK